MDLRAWPGTSAARRVCRAEYTGTRAVRLTLFELPDLPDATAFGAFQSWLPLSRPDKVGFFNGRYFGVAESPQADRAALERFTLAFKKSLP